MNKKDLRMVCLVPYNLSPIQQGIQSAHAIAEHSLLKETLYLDWLLGFKTIIILNAGTTGPKSTMESHVEALDKLGVHYSFFTEPDLNDAMTAIAFIVDYKNDNHIVGYLRSMKLA